MHKIETKFWCRHWRVQRDIEDCISCTYRDDCNQDEKYHAGYYIRRMILLTFIGVVLFAIVFAIINLFT